MSLSLLTCCLLKNNKWANNEPGISEVSQSVQKSGLDNGQNGIPFDTHWRDGGIRC
jgi:hypothetical protein